MKKLLLIFFASFLVGTAFSQSAADAAVQLAASVSNSPAQIILRWVGNGTTNQYMVYRKPKGASSWGTALATLAGSVTVYIDNTALIGDNYEYLVTRAGTNYSGQGYINAGIEVPEIDYRGKLIVLVDSTMLPAVTSEMKRYIDDVEGDGWEVIRHDVDRNGSVLHVKSLILADYAIDTTQIKAVAIFGHVPVPYSGNINPDGHGDHLGAWPADVYYGDIDGVWTDNFVTSTTASPARTQNVPGDGKFDQSIVPGAVELQVGRVDFAGMSTFTLSEQQLLKNYLDKDHDYRKKIFVPVRQGVIDDNFGYFGSEAFAASGYKNMAPLVSSSSVTAADYFTSQSSASYLWSYGCGGGSYTSASGIGTTANFASANLQGVFTMLFGSYFGDWDAPNSLLKAPLAQGKTLTNCWSGRVHYQFHHMGLGENIGYGLLATQNNFGGVYFGSPTNITGLWIHNALMGDPTLRNDIVSPVANVVATRVSNDCYISWSASTQTNLIGYNLYAKNDSANHYVKLNTLPITSTTYTDYCLQYKGIYTYMVRALVLEEHTSGSYYNMSEGIADTAYNPNQIRTWASFTNTVSVTTVSFTSTSINATQWFWKFSNGVQASVPNPVVSFTANGTYAATLVAVNACSQDTSIQFFTIQEVGLKEFLENEKVTVYPNPAQERVYIKDWKGAGAAVVTLYDLSGRKLLVQEYSDTKNYIDISSLAKGTYILQIRDAGKQQQLRLVKE